MYGRYWHHAHRCGPTRSRLLWFVLGAGVASWWHVHKEHAGWYQARHCGRDRIPQHAYPAPGAPLPPSFSIPAAPSPDAQNAHANAPTPGTVDKWDRWGWGQWGKGSSPGQENPPNGNPNAHWDRWGWGNRGPHAGAGSSTQPQRPEGAWGPPMPMPASSERAPEKDVVQQATETITELSEATLNNLLVTVESLKAKLAEHRMQREQQERELQALREAKFKQFEEWQRQQEQLLKEDVGKDGPPRRLV
ncbi:hypothetical protein BD309DRAFT_960500, partial [Dichomitus squalens]